MTKIDCLKCEHFKITWNTAFPRACSVFDIKTSSMPSLVVFNATGQRCPSFSEKARGGGGRGGAGGGK